MTLEPKQYIAIIRAEQRVREAHREYLALMAAVGLDGNRPHRFDDVTQEITPVEIADPPLVQPS